MLTSRYAMWMGWGPSFVGTLLVAAVEALLDQAAYKDQLG